MAAESQRVCLLLADLSGYTAYLAASEPERAPTLVADLVETIVRQLRPTFRLEKLEGDAAFMVAPLDGLTGEALLDAIDATMAAFQARLLSMAQATTCTCEACRRIPELDLKFVVHTGEVVAQKVAGRTELAGVDAIVAHRLLKAEAPAGLGVVRYALFTDATVERLGLDPMALAMQAGIERFDYLGEIRVHVLDLAARSAGRSPGVGGTAAPAVAGGGRHAAIRPDGHVGAADRSCRACAMGRPAGHRGRDARSARGRQRVGVRGRSAVDGRGDRRLATVRFLRADGKAARRPTFDDAPRARAGWRWHAAARTVAGFDADGLSTRSATGSIPTAWRGEMRIGELARRLGVSGDSVSFYEREGWLRRRHDRRTDIATTAKATSSTCAVDRPPAHRPALDTAARLASWCRSGHSTRRPRSCRRSLPSNAARPTGRIEDLRLLDERLAQLTGICRRLRRRRRVRFGGPRQPRLGPVAWRAVLDAAAAVSSGEPKYCAACASS